MANATKYVDISSGDCFSLRCVSIFCVAAKASTFALVWAICLAAYDAMRFAATAPCNSWLTRVDSPMLCVGDNKKIFNSVVRLDSVDVVNCFVWQQPSAEMLLHDESVLKNTASTNDINNSIAVRSNITLPLGCGNLQFEGVTINMPLPVVAARFCHFGLCFVRPFPSDLVRCFRSNFDTESDERFSDLFVICPNLFGDVGARASRQIRCLQPFSVVDAVVHSVVIRIRWASG